jgi:hypothetical protein
MLHLADTLYGSLETIHRQAQIAHYLAVSVRGPEDAPDKSCACYYLGLHCLAIAQTLLILLGVSGTQPAVVELKHRVRNGQISQRLMEQRDRLAARAGCHGNGPSALWQLWQTA